MTFFLPMIDYLPAESDIFTKHRDYTSNVANQLEAAGYTVTGSCSSYGFTIKAKQTYSDGTSVHLTLLQHQSTHSGINNPTAIDSAQGKLIITGLPPIRCLRCGKSALKRFFMASIFKSFCPAPYYLTTRGKAPNEAHLQKLMGFIQQQTIYSFVLKNGKLRVYFEGVKSTPKTFVDQIRNLEAIL